MEDYHKLLYIETLPLIDDLHKLLKLSFVKSLIKVFTVPTVEEINNNGQVKNKHVIYTNQFGIVFNSFIAKKSDVKKFFGICMTTNIIYLVYLLQTDIVGLPCWIYYNIDLEALNVKNIKIEVNREYFLDHLVNLIPTTLSCTLGSKMIQH